MHDNWLRKLQDDEPPKSSWRPRKSTKSWEKLSVQKFTKITQSRKKVHRVGPTEPRGVEGKYKNSRCASREKTWVQSTKTLNENWDAVSLVFLSNLSHVMFLNVWNCSHLRSEGKVQNWVRRWTCYLNICEAHGLNTWGQLLHLRNNGRKIQYYAENFVLLVVHPGFYRLVLPALPHLRLRHRYRRTMNILSCVQQQYEVIIWVNKHKETCYKPSHRTTNKHWWNPLPPELPWGKGVSGKEFTLTSWKTEIANCRRARTTWTQCKRRTGEAIPRAAKFGRTDSSRAQSLNWDLWMRKQSPIRYRASKFGSLKIRDETKLQGRHGVISWNLVLICEVDHGIIENKRRKTTVQN